MRARKRLPELVMIGKEFICLFKRLRLRRRAEKAERASAMEFGVGHRWVLIFRRWIFAWLLI